MLILNHSPLLSLPPGMKHFKSSEHAQALAFEHYVLVYVGRRARSLILLEKFGSVHLREYVWISRYMI